MRLDRQIAASTVWKILHRAGIDPAPHWARFAEDGGFDTLVVSDHVVLTPEVAAIYPEPFHDPFVLLAWLARRTSTVRLGTSVVLLPTGTRCTRPG